jgi:diguanylate cyclase
MSSAPITQPDFRNATQTAGRALQLMAQHKVPATPQNFELWFTFALGTKAELNKTINVLIDNKRTFDADTNRSLYLTYVGGGAEWDAQRAAFSEQLLNVISCAQAFLTVGIADSRAHVEALSGVAAQIRRNLDPHAIVQSLIGELGKAVTRATTLEASFSASLQELDRVRNDFAAVEQVSKTDALTGLANRRALEEFLRIEQIAAMENGLPLSILLLDVDHFKKFNDQFGHQTGDQVLRLIAGVLKDGIREHDLAARYGGEELIAVLPGADLDVSMQVAERIRRAISRRQITRRATGEVLSSLTVSIGVAQFAPGEALTSLLDRCDRALYAAKRGGRDRTVSERDVESDQAVA